MPRRIPNLFAVKLAAVLIVASAVFQVEYANAHTSEGFLPLQFQGYHAPFGTDETETYTEVYGSNGYAYLGSLASGVAIIDISDQAALTTSAVFGANSGNAFVDILVVDGVGYFSSNSGGTYLVDLTTPSDPILLNQISSVDNGFDSVTNALVYQDQLFQVSETSSEIAVFDVSNPMAPSFITRIETSDSVGVYDLSANDGWLYAAGLGGMFGEGAAYIYDITNLSSGSVSLIGQIATGINTASVAASSDHSQMFVSHRETGGTLAAWDISDLSAAFEIESIDASDLDVNALSAGEIIVLDSTAYVAWHQAGVQVVDLDLLEQSDTIFRVGAFGTSQASPLEGFVGNTSVFPINHDQVLLSDTRWGLYFVDASNVVTSPAIMLGDVNQDDAVDFSDIPPFIDFLISGNFLEEADCNQDNVVDFSDIPSFIAILVGS
jgi:hypothetical protein